MNLICFMGLILLLYPRESMYKVNGELSVCDITYSGRVPSREGDIHNFA